jgi:DNA-binding response OmpR family regulator
MEKILLIEDDEAIAATVRAWLSMHKFNVRAVETGAEALEELQFGKYDLILLDWNLPDMDGVEICQQFRAAGGITPIIMLSGNSSDAEKKQALRSGATDFMPKPFDFNELIQRMRSLITAPQE